MSLIRESQNWKNLNVPLTTEFKELEILNSSPIPSNLGNLDFRFNTSTIEEISEFLKKNNQTASGNINLWPTQLSENPDACYTSLYSGNKLVGFALATIIPIKVSKNYQLEYKDSTWDTLKSPKTLLFGYTSHLCTSDK